MTHTLHTRSPWFVAVATTVALALTTTACRTDSPAGGGYPGVAGVEVVARGSEIEIGQTHDEPPGVPLGPTLSVTEEVRISDFVAETTVVEVGDLRFDTESGERLSESELEALQLEDPYAALAAESVYRLLVLDAVEVFAGVTSVDGFVLVRYGGELDGVVYEPSGGDRFDPVLLEDYSDGVVFLSQSVHYTESLPAGDLGVERWFALAAAQDKASELSVGGQSYEVGMAERYFHYIGADAVDIHNGIATTESALLADIQEALE